LPLAPAPEELVAAEPLQRRDQPAPVRSHLARRQRHLVVVPRDGGVLDGFGRAAHAGSQRRSSVIGCRGLCSGAGTATASGVWPNGEKRAPRRASASYAFTGNTS